MSCPNYSINGILYRKFGLSSPHSRSLLFYAVCVPLRFITYGAILYTMVSRPDSRFSEWVALAVFVFALVAAVRLGFAVRSEGGDKQWWSKSFQFLIATLILVAYIRRERLTIPLLLFISLGGGIIQSLITPFC